MGGTAGHLQHVIEDRSLTFGELKELLRSVSMGKLEAATEKVDGQQLAITYRGGSLRAARNKGDIKQGGIDAKTLAARFAGRGSVHDAFTRAFNVLERAVASLPPKQIRAAFRDGRFWHSIEIMYSGNRNVVNYDGDWITFHSTGTTAYDENADPVDDPAAEAAWSALESSVESMQDAIRDTNWNIVGPHYMQLKALSSKEPLKRALKLVDSAMAMRGYGVGVDDYDTIGDYVDEAVDDALRREKWTRSIDDATFNGLVHRFSAGEGSLVQLTSRMTAAEKQGVKSFQSKVPAVIDRALAPLDRAVTGLAAEVLRGLESAFVLDGDAEAKRLRKELARAVAAIESSGNEAAVAIARKQLSRIASMDDVATAVEGVVFKFKGKLFKVTGAFAPLNAILGLFMYGRGSIPPLAKQHEAVLRSIVHTALLIG